MLLILLVIVNFCYGFELTGSEHAYHRHSHRNAEKHKTLPYIFHPLYFKGIGQVNSNVQPPKKTGTITKTIVVEITKNLHKQPVCVKASPGIPYCHSNLQIKATPVLQTPFQEATKVIGVLEKSREMCHKSHQGREGREINPSNHIGQPPELFFKEIHTTTEILRITRVNEYVDTIVTATLIAENCVPVNEDLPPCPVEMKDCIYPYKPGLGHIQINGKEEIERKIDEVEDVTLFSDESTSFNSSMLF